MAEYQTVRAATTGARAAQIDEGLRAHMNKVYGTMSVGMVVTAGVAWAVGSSDALLSIFRDPVTLVAQYPRLDRDVPAADHGLSPSAQ
jgi:FtsH-binding integral membrane protein